VIETLADVMLVRLGTGTLYIKPGSPGENGYCESFHGKLRNECLKGEIFCSVKEAQTGIEPWRVECNPRRPPQRPVIGRRYRRSIALWSHPNHFCSAEL
jgi:transposase InsO family protein